jgi:hypothetical protein
MIINGGSRRGGAFFARHLTRTDQNERVTIAEIRGLAASNVRDAFREMEAVASGTRCLNYFYHANLNPREDERLTPEQWQRAADTLEASLGLTGQPRIVVEHQKEGRTHRHVVWSRIDADSMTAISDSLTYRKHEVAAREIEQACGHEPVPSVLVKGREIARPTRNPQDWESFRGQESKRDPKAVKAEVTALWRAADSGTAFAAALEEQGYILTRGDRRDFCIVDPAGDEHSLARRIDGAKAAEIRARMADVDRESLPSVDEGRELARQRQDATGDSAAPATEEPTNPDLLPDGRIDAAEEAPPTTELDPPPADVIVSVADITHWSQQPVGHEAGRARFYERAGRAMASFFGIDWPRAAADDLPDGVSPSPSEPELGHPSAPHSDAAAAAIAAFFGTTQPSPPDPAATGSTTTNLDGSATQLVEEPAANMAAEREAVSDFDSVHKANIVQASIDLAVLEKDEGGDMGLRLVDKPAADGSAGVLAAMHHETIAQATPPALSMIARENATEADFDIVHQQNIRQATDDLATIREEEASGSRYQRIQAWWSRAREYYDEWREHVHSRVERFRSDRVEPTPDEPRGPEL